MASFILTSIVNASTVVISRFGIKGRWSKWTAAIGKPSGGCLCCGKKLSGVEFHAQSVKEFICVPCVEKQIVPCVFCGTKVPRGTIPLPSDNAAWAEIATQHSPSCEWVKTRGERKKPAAVKPRHWTGKGWETKG